ncbi:FAD-binding oxidoreductase [Sphaerisporangium rhizosphaerae]|uniref:FAD-binding oxidoreductase n=1 Tax=Sphaerisporangium rhizosphaerae TaxID=2269375 RepID=A0ABW2P3F1_9ACTN
MTESVGELRARLGPRLLTGEAVQAYRHDAAPLAAPGVPLAVVRAREEGDVQQALRWAHRHHVAVVPRGGGTGLAGGATAVDGCLVVSLAGMDRIVEMRADDQYCVVQAGVITADLDRAAARHGLMYAPDPSSHETSTIGGNLATNAGGLRCVKYGVTRDWTLGLRAVLADGRVLATGRRTVKGVAGYDLTGLLVGSEGTLGVIVEATLRLRPRPSGAPVTVVAQFPLLEAAATAALEITRAGLDPGLMELLDAATLAALSDHTRMDFEEAAALLLVQFDGAGREDAADAALAVLTRGGAGTALRSESAAEAAELVGLRRLAYPALARRGVPFTEDVCVPRSRLAEMVRHIQAVAAAHACEIATVAHAGDGNLHPLFVLPHGTTGIPANVSRAADEIFARALELGGTLTGEHGVGTLKRRWLEREMSAECAEVTRAVKWALDPHGILNPGKAVPFPGEGDGDDLPG